MLVGSSAPAAGRFRLLLENRADAPVTVSLAGVTPEAAAEEVVWRLADFEAGGGGGVNVFQQNAGMGRGGGQCACPDGAVYWVGTANVSAGCAGGLACAGGSTISCSEEASQQSCRFGPRLGRGDEAGSSALVSDGS